MTSLRPLLATGQPICAPLVLNPMMAMMADKAGFDALYLGGGATGYAKALLEANLNVSEMCAAGTEIAAVTTRPLILDGATGFGDPMHMHRTIPMVETAGFAAIEIEDQLIPKRAHHHIGVERMIAPDLMAAKVAEACAARRSDDFVIIARTNAVRNTGIEDAIHRLELYKKAGADVLLASPRNAEEARFLGERLPAPLMHLCSPGGLAAIGLSKQEMADLGWKILADPGTGLFAAYETWRNLYAELAGDFKITSRPHTDWRELEHEMHAAIDLPKLIAVEKRTVEKDG
ncbi:MAG: isocitrate lyase/PEP mutase family protein [Alphaproteobacteria bacterium]|nr:isocitrate lyase/PEP mutase family protein [Alphaproteobacteria bacterium]MCB9930137.1 isocitrate lyase/PEP mutase family protein [Alphaproteobacteria bacterium]